MVVEEKMVIMLSLISAIKNKILYLKFKSDTKKSEVFSPFKFSISFEKVTCF